MFDYEGFRNGVRTYRLQNGYTQEKLSEIVGVSEHHLSQVERGETQPGFSLIINLCNALEVSVEDCVKCERDQNILLLNQLRDYLKEFNLSDKKFLYSTLVCLEELFCSTTNGTD